MKKSVQDGFWRMQEQLPETDICMRKQIARWIGTLPRDPWSYYTTGCILREIGPAKTNLSGLLGWCKW